MNKLKRRRDIIIYDNNNPFNHISDFKNSFNIQKLVDYKLDNEPRHIYDKPIVENTDLILDPNNEDIALFRYFKRMYPYADDTIAKKNLQTLEYKKLRRNIFSYLKLIEDDTQGLVNIPLNRIYLKNPNDKSCKIHELMHLFSSTIYNDVQYSGFAQDNGTFGEFNFDFITEAYALLLEDRLTDNYIPELYDTYRTIFLLESIVGHKQLLNQFFTADVNSLIKTLENYLPRREIIRYLRMLDACFLLMGGNKFNQKRNEDMLDALFEEVDDFESYLAESYQDISKKKLVIYAK